MSEPKITRRKLADYQNDPRNANIGSPRGLGVIEDSLNYSGVGRSLVADKNGVLIAGNKTSDAAAIAGIEDVIEIETDGNALIVHKRRDLDLAHDARAKALAVSDNRASELSLTWDNEQLAELLTEIKNEDETLLKASGFYTSDLNQLLAQIEETALNDAQREWEGMPVFENEAQEAYHSLTVHFATEKDMSAFAQLIGQTVTAQTKYINIPFSKMSLKEYRVK